ncbi:MAG TPA: WYL domain-containing protein [Candidatus Melainabacteria bacterium]|nr:WYL domain-containing protein [Candidatus Melainabacteria bacterium]
MFDLNESEFTSLTLSTKIATGHARFIKNDLDSAMEKIGGRVAENVGKNALGTLEQVHNAHVPHAPIKQKTFDELKSAIDKRNPIELSYYAASTNESTTRTVEPYKLIQHQGTWYLLAFCNMRQDLRLFALHRILGLKTVRERRFERYRELDIESWLSRAFQIERKGNDQEWKVRILFRKEAAPYIREKIWQAGQQLEEKKDGSLVLTFNTLSLPEVKRWVLYYGANAVVLSPKPLVAMIEEELMSALKNYGAQVSQGRDTRSDNGFNENEDRSAKRA